MRRMKKMMGKINRFLAREDVGAIGIGAMIVFIAMVLVAGIAASVLIQTSGRLEMQAMQTGTETIGEVSTGLSVFDIVGLRNNGNLSYIGITVRPRSGAPNIDLNETIIVISDGTRKAVLLYNGWTNANRYNASVGADGSLFNTATLAWDQLTNSQFGILVLQDYDGSCTQLTPVINKGDKVVLAIRAAAAGVFGSEIPVRTHVFGRVVPEIGSPGIISFTTPPAYNDPVLDLL
jgi:archaeal flagellin FlaB